MAGVFWGGFGKSYFSTNKITSKNMERCCVFWNDEYGGNKNIMGKCCTKENKIGEGVCDDKNMFVVG